MYPPAGCDEDDLDTHCWRGYLLAKRCGRCQAHQYPWCCIPPDPESRGSCPSQKSTGVTCALSGLGLPTELGCDGSQASICIQLGEGGGLKIYVWADHFTSCGPGGGREAI